MLIRSFNTGFPRRSNLFHAGLIMASLSIPVQSVAEPIELGARPQTLVDGLPDGSLGTTLKACVSNIASRSDFSIGHRGAPLGYPEHTQEGYIAAARMGAGVIECDATFTNDQALVCRHSQCDLHTTTNILQTPLANKCTVPPDMSSSTPFSEVQCCTSDLSLAEFKTLRGRPDSGNKDAKTLEEYLKLEDSVADRMEALEGTLMTHRESIRLFQSLGVKMIPELKEALVDMPFRGTSEDGLTQKQYAQLLVDEYIAENINPNDVYLQSFNLDDVNYWIENAPEFGQQATWLDGRYRDSEFNINKEKSWTPSMTELAQSNVKYLAPPLWMLLTLDKNKQIVPSEYAVAAKDAGLNLIGWTLERSGSLTGGGGWYHQTIKSAINNDSDLYNVVHALADGVGVSGLFSDWPATTTYYANCMGFD